MQVLVQTFRGEIDTEKITIDILLDPDFWENATVEQIASAMARGANVRKRDDNGKTPQHWEAGTSSNPDVAGLLLDRGWRLTHAIRTA